VFSGVSSVSTRDTEEPGGCEAGVFTAEELDRVGDTDSEDTTMVNVEILLEG
jgi:hypothetical protein